jgi:hypothetical protein
LIWNKLKNKNSVGEVDMSRMIRKIIDKVEEYGEESKYQGDPGGIGIHTFVCDYSILVYKEKEKKLYISFNAATTPTRAAADILIFKQIRGLVVDIADPYFHKLKEDGTVEMVTGDRASDAFIEAVGDEAVTKFMEVQKQLQLLHVVEGYHC